MVVSALGITVKLHPAVLRCFSLSEQSFMDNRLNPLLISAQVAVRGTPNFISKPDLAISTPLAQSTTRPYQNENTPLVMAVLSTSMFIIICNLRPIL
jgi:hypothetical protein